MLIEAQASFTIQLPEGPRQLVTGDQLDLPNDKARKLLKLAGEKVRLVQPQVQTGAWVEFSSPLFGLVTARIKNVEVDGIWITEHSVLKGADEPCRIPASWICGVYRDA